MSSPNYKTSGLFVLEFNYIGSAGGYISSANEYNYHLTNDNVLCMEYDGKKTAVANVDSYIAARKDDNGTVYAYFMTTDGTVWSYSFGKQEYVNVTEGITPESVNGDINADGICDVADVVLLQKWLLDVPDTKLKNWKSADFYEDDKLDVFDLCLMKKKLLK